MAGAGPDEVVDTEGACSSSVGLALDLGLCMSVRLGVCDALWMSGPGGPTDAPLHSLTPATHLRGGFGYHCFHANLSNLCLLSTVSSDSLFAIGGLLGLRGFPGRCRGVGGDWAVHSAAPYSTPRTVLLQHGQNRCLLRGESKCAEGARRGADTVALGQHGCNREAPSTPGSCRQW